MNSTTMLERAKQFAPQIPIKVLPPEKLVMAAAKEFRARKGYELKTADARIVVNFIRHKLAAYDKLMTMTRANKANGYNMRAILRAAILIAIEQRYAHMPVLVAEARKQLQATVQEHIERREQGPTFH